MRVWVSSKKDETHGGTRRTLYQCSVIEINSIVGENKIVCRPFWHEDAIIEEKFTSWSENKEDLVENVVETAQLTCMLLHTKYVYQLFKLRASYDIRSPLRSPCPPGGSARPHSSHGEISSARTLRIAASMTWPLPPDRQQKSTHHMCQVSPTTRKMTRNGSLLTSK